MPCVFVGSLFGCVTPSGTCPTIATWLEDLEGSTQKANEPICLFAEDGGRRFGCAANRCFFSHHPQATGAKDLGFWEVCWFEYCKYQNMFANACEMFDNWWFMLYCSAISARFMRTTTCDCDMKKYENSGGGAENNLWRCAHVTFEFVWVRGQFWSLITDRHSGICTSMYRHSQSLRTYVWFWNTYNCLIIHHLWAFLSKFLAQFPPQKTPMSLSKPNSQPWSPRCRLQEWEASPCVALDR